MMRAALFHRLGGVLIRPRATVAGLGAEVGRGDEWVLTAIFVLGSQMGRLGEAIASVAAIGLSNGLLVLASAAGRAVLPPILVSVLLDNVLGRERGHRRGLFLVPLVLVASLAQLLRQQGIALAGPSYLPELVGAIWCGALALAARSSIPPLAEPPAEEAK